MKYVKPTAVDSPTVGCLYQAREWKSNTWKMVKRARQAFRDEMGKPIASRDVVGRKLAVIKAESAHFEASLFETQCLRTLEQRANELGLTTIRAKVSA